MAGTALNNTVTKISAGRLVRIFYACAIPAAGAVMALETDGTPLAASNPSAKHLGLTDKGCVLTAKPSPIEFRADEQIAPIKTVFDQMDMRIQADFLQVEDTVVMTLLTAGFGTLESITGGTKYGFGIAELAYSSIAAIWASEADPTKFCIFHIYKGANQAGLDGLVKSTKEKSMAKADFKAYDIPSRAATDSCGYYFIPS